MKELSYSGYLSLVGLGLTFIVILDGFGVFQRAKIKQALAEKKRLK